MSSDLSGNFTLVLFGLFFFSSFFRVFRATFMAHGGSQARVPIAAVAANLHHSHRNARWELGLQPTP